MFITLIGHTTPVCGNGSVTIYDSVTGGTLPYSYGWTGPSGYSSTDHNPVIFPVTTSILGNYHLVVTDAHGCQVTGDTTVSYITPIPSAGTISGTDSVCVGATVHLNETSTGGTWSATNANATVDGVGNVTGAINGIDTIRYITSNACGADTARFIIRILPLPTLGTISGPSSVCVNSSINLTATPGGGTWSVSNANATIGVTTGILTGVTAGLTTVSYTTSNSCGTVYATTAVTINALPTITPSPASVCVGATVTLTGSGSGATYVWTHYDHTVDTLFPGSLSSTTRGIQGLAAGTDSIYLTNTTTGCTGKDVLTINPLPAPIVGPTHLCVGDTIRHSDATPGGRWTTSSSGTLALTPDLTLLDTNLRGVSAGVAVDTYRIAATGCYVTQRDTVFGLPALALSPAAGVYCSGAPVDLFAAASASGVYPSIAPFTYTWAPTGYLTPVTDSEMLAAGMSSVTVFTVTVTDARGCHRSATSTVLLACDGLCMTDSPIQALGVGGTIPAGYYTGTYYLDNGIPGPGTINISGGCTFVNAVVAIAPGKKILVGNSSGIIIDHSHFYCCRPDSMWQGIVLAGSFPNAVMTVRNNSLIEDAIRAVDISNFPTTATNVFISNNTIFNRNRVSVYISNFSSFSTSPFPFYISNTGFTSRDFSKYYDGTRSYPFAWPTLTGDLLGSYVPAGYSPVQPPFNIENPAGMRTVAGFIPFSMVQCKQANIGDAYAGLLLNLVGNNAASRYPGMLLVGNTSGKGTDSSNLFDNLNYGILDSSGDLTVRANIFMYCHQPTGSGPYADGGVGIKAYNATSSGTGKYQITADRGLMPPPDEYESQGNLFYDCRTAIETYNMHGISLNYSEAYSRHHGTFDTLKGKYGFRMSYAANTRDTVGVALSAYRNYFGNIDSGIYLIGMESIQGDFTLRRNQFIVPVPNFNAGYSRQAIYVSNNGLDLPGTTGNLYIDSNETLLTLNGIYVNRARRRYAVTNYNNVYLQYGGSQVNYGIQHTNCISNRIQNNYVRGGVLVSRNNSIGISGESNTNANVTCDSVNYLKKGFNFSGANNTTNWRRNTMDNCTYGFYLASGISYIGSGIDTTVAFDNIWYGSWPSSSTFQTYNAGSSSAALSKMFVRVNSGSLVFDPYINGPAFPFTSTNFNWPSACSPSSCWGGGIGHPIDSSTLSCVPTGVTFPVYRDYLYGVTDTSVTDTTGGDPKPRSAMRSGAHIDERMRWIEQMHVWNALRMFPAMADSSAALAQFKTFALNSRYAWLTSIENAVYSEDIVTAQALLGHDIDEYVNTSTDSATSVAMADVPEADYVVNNYLTFYDLYLKYQQGILSADDSSLVFTIAGMCPVVDGEVVYQARGLSSLLGTSIGGNDDDCVAASENRGTNQLNQRSGMSTSGDKAYVLYPNPNNGQITVSCRTGDNRGVQAEIVDAMGRTIYSGTLNFAAQTSRLSLPQGSSAGLYLLKITNADGEVFNFKFVVQ